MAMEIREARAEDAQDISRLLTQLGYPGTEGFIGSKIELLAADPNEELIVGIDEGRIAAVMSIHFIPQLALRGSFARISYFCVDESSRGRGAGRKMEEYCERVARGRGCDRIEVHCHSRRKRAHAFYARQGYEESPKYLIKQI